MKTIDEVCDELSYLAATESWTDAKAMEILNAFAKEQVLDDRMQRTADDIYRLSYERGRVEALDEAAKAIMADGWNSAGDWIDSKFHAERLAELIRALKKP